MIIVVIIQDINVYKNVNLYQLPTNKGKRDSQSYAFERSNVYVFFTVDSDTKVLHFVYEVGIIYVILGG